MKTQSRRSSNAISMTDFRLIETMRVSEKGEVHLLERHLLRLRRSARYFSFKCDSEKLRDAILRPPRRINLHACVCCCPKLARLNSIRSRCRADSARAVETLAVRVNSRDPFLHHKTTNRGIYEEARRECDKQTDAILINERDEITETTITNIAVYRDRQWITPRALLRSASGRGRAELLARGDIVEGVIHVDDLMPGEPIRCFNALRGVFDLELKT